MKCPYPIPWRLRLKLAWLAWQGLSYHVVIGFAVGNEVNHDRPCDTRRWAGRNVPCGNKAVVTMEPCAAQLDYYAGGVWHLCPDCAQALREYTKERQKEL